MISVLVLQKRCDDLEEDNSDTENLMPSNLKYYTHYAPTLIYLQYIRNWQPKLKS